MPAIGRAWPVNAGVPTGGFNAELMVSVVPAGTPVNPGRPIVPPYPPTGASATLVGSAGAGTTTVPAGVGVGSGVGVGVGAGEHVGCGVGFHSGDNRDPAAGLAELQSSTATFTVAVGLGDVVSVRSVTSIAHVPGPTEVTEYVMTPLEALARVGLTVQTWSSELAASAEKSASRLESSSSVALKVCFE